MDIGKTKFYPKDDYNTSIYKAAIIFLFAGNLCCISSFVLIMLEGDQLLITLGFSITVIFFVISGCLAFVYSFAPIFLTIKYKPKNRTVAVLAIACHIVLQVLGGPASFAWQVGTCADVLIRFGVITIVGMPPPKKLLKFIKNKLYGMNALNTSIRERGVISSGIVELERCHYNSYRGISGIGGGGCYNGISGGGGISGGSVWQTTSPS
ncbi:6647_t:CDS:2 [Diversispora eburnea]|uniref:6647_t:CDS:1 n=1 Tax=Diversispora eburnea TaxID=1213867 RepID=A0A9N8VF44_9GLOM|nr:6647_t:CDS:2 [Diversispora eburnea]